MNPKRLLAKLSALFLLAVSGLAAAQDASPAVVQLGDETVTEAQFDERFALAARSIAARQGLPYTPETQALFDQLRPTYLDQVATELVLLNEAETRNITVSDEDVDTQLSQIRENMGGEEAFNTFLNESGFADEAAFSEFLRDNLTVQALLDNLRQDITVSDEDVQTFYDENQEQIGQPLDQVRDQVRAAVVQERINQQIADLRSASDVQTFPENLTPLEIANGESGGAMMGETGGATVGGETGGESGGGESGGGESGGGESGGGESGGG